jgi:hypothetical protein
MKAKITIVFLLLILTKNSFSQNIIEIKYEQSQTGDMVFTASNSDYCDYLVTLKFDQLSNTNITPFVQVNVKPGSAQVLKLTPSRLNESIGFSLSYSWLKGTSKPKIDPSFLYLLPIKTGQNTRAIQLKDLKEFLGKPVTEPWYQLGFTMNTGDTIYASRGGIVCKINAGNGSTASRGVMYTSLTNSVEIFHTDGTFAKYDLLKKDGILVKPGAKVNAGDPIGIVGNVYSDPRVYFMVYYLDEKKINNTGVITTAGYSSYKPKFIINEKEGGDYINTNDSYIAYKPVNVITREMSKREKEKFLNGDKK